MKCIRSIIICLMLVLIIPFTLVNAEAHDAKVQIEIADNDDFENAEIIKDWEDEWDNIWDNDGHWKFEALNLGPGTTYYFRAKAKNGDGEETVWSEKVSKITIPSTPSFPSLEATGTSSIKACWVEITGADEYILYRDNEMKYTGSLLEHEDVDLAVNTQYSYTLESSNESGQSGQGDAAKLYTLANIPINLEIEKVESSSLTLIWENNGNPDGTLYKLYRDSAEIFEGTDKKFVDTGVVAGTTYKYEVTAINGDGIETVKSDDVEYRIKTAPSTVALIDIESNKITVEWDKNGNPDGTVYEVSLFDEDDEDIEIEVAYTQISEEDNKVVFNDLTPNKLYYATVRTRIEDDLYTDAIESDRKYTLALKPVLIIEEATQDSIKGRIEFEE